VLARAGLVDEAVAVLDEAERGFVSMGATPDAAEVQVLRAESHVLCREPGAALAELERAAATDADAASAPLALRVRAYAQAQLGERDAALATFDQAVAAAREGEGAFELFESIVGRARLEPNGSPQALLEESRGIVIQLGIVAVTCPPL
jgi:tetratricopeptide (TPR) repeat protein